MNSLIDKIDLFYKLASSLNKKQFDSITPSLSPWFDNPDDLRMSTERTEYLSNKRKINSGSTRSAYILNSKKALKVADDEFGINQNKNEFNILKNHPSIILPKVYDHAKDFSWIEVELVRPLNNNQEIEDLTGIIGKDFCYIMNNGNNYQLTIDNELKYFYNQINEVKSNIDNREKFFVYEDLKMFTSKINNWKKYKNNTYLKAIFDLVNSCSIDAKEFSYFFNLGKSASGNLVLLDLGKLNT